MKSILSSVIAGFVIVGTVPAQKISASASLFASAQAFSASQTKYGGFGMSVTASAQRGTAIAIATASAFLVTKLKVKLWTSTKVLTPSHASAYSYANAVLVITAPKLMSGTIEVLGKASVKLGGAAKWTLVTRSLRIPVCVGPSGLSIRVLATSSAFARAVTVEFQPKTSNVTSYGPKCAAELQGAWYPWQGSDVFYFRTTKAPSTPFNFMLFGTKRLSLQLPPSNCLLLTDLPVFVPLSIVRGVGELRLQIPRISGLAFNAQLLGSDKPMPNVYWRTSNALQFKLP